MPRPTAYPLHLRRLANQAADRAVAQGLGPDDDLDAVVAEVIAGLSRDELVAVARHELERGASS